MNTRSPLFWLTWLIATAGPVDTGLELAAVNVVCSHLVQPRNRQWNQEAVGKFRKMVVNSEGEPKKCIYIVYDEREGLKLVRVEDKFSVS